MGKRMETTIVYCSTDSHDSFRAIYHAETQVGGNSGALGAPLEEAPTRTSTGLKPLQH